MRTIKEWQSLLKAGENEMKEKQIRKKVMLIAPPFTQSKKAMKRCIFPLGIGYLASVLEKSGCNVKVLDCVVEGYDIETIKVNGEITFGLTPSDICTAISEFNPDFVGVSCLMSRQSENAHHVCELAKNVNPDIITIMGGTHVSALAEYVIKDKNVDYALIGDAEETIIDIIEGKNKKGIVRCKPVDINKLPYLARHLFSMGKYIDINMPTSCFSPYRRVTQIETTRGCPFNCCFCATSRFKGKYQARDVDNVLDEIRLLKEEYHIEELDIIDSNFILNKGRTLKLLKGIKEIGIAWTNGGGIWVGGLDEDLIKAIKESGCYQLSLAIESSSPRILKDIIDKPTNIDMVEPVVKLCKKYKIDLHAFFILGFPEQTIEEMRNDYKFALKMGFSSASFNIISPLAGSRIYDQYKDKITFDKIDLRKSSIPHPEISAEELEEMVHNFNKKFNSSLFYRNPKIFVKKYIYTLLRKKSLNFMFKMFNRQ
jgi:radical SAM superfamily enzyme YgiQ (UPF0313 family)